MSKEYGRAMLTVRTDISEDVSELLQTAPKAVRNNLKKEINRLADETRRDIYKEVKRRYTLKAGRFGLSDIKKETATTSGLTAKLSVEGNPFSLLQNYRTRKNGKRTAVKVEIIKGEGLKPLITSDGIKAFIQTVKINDKKSGRKQIYTGVFQRFANGKEHRTPFNWLHGPGRAKIAEVLFRDMRDEKGQELQEAIMAIAERIMR